MRREGIPYILPRVYKDLVKHVVNATKFNLGITCYPESIAIGDFYHSESLYTSMDKDFIELLVKYLIDYSLKLLPDKCLNKEYIKVDDLVEEITGKYTIYIIY